jgi:hypothetical protein
MLTLIARYWNEIEWINTSLKYILQWNPDKIIISEGNWSSHPSFKGREHSTDGTREVIEDFVKANHERSILIDGVHDSADYRTNQAATCNKALELSDAKIGDWFITIDCDSFIHDWAIEKLKDGMELDYKSCYFPYFIHHFFWDLETCALLQDIHGNLLPRKIVEGAKFITANHFGIGKNYYTGIPTIKSYPLTTIRGHHYCHIKNEQRVIDRYNMGDKLKQKPEKKGYDKKRIPFTGVHPAIVREHFVGEYHAVS